MSGQAAAARAEQLEEVGVSANLAASRLFGERDGERDGGRRKRRLSSYLSDYQVYHSGGAAGGAAGAAGAAGVAGAAGACGDGGALQQAVGVAGGVEALATERVEMVGVAAVNVATECVGEDDDDDEEVVEVDVEAVDLGGEPVVVAPSGLGWLNAAVDDDTPGPLAPPVAGQAEADEVAVVPGSGVAADAAGAAEAEQHRIAARERKLEELQAEHRRLLDVIRSAQRGREELEEQMLALHEEGMLALNEKGGEQPEGGVHANADPEAEDDAH